MHGAEVYWINSIAPWRLAIGPRPRGNDWLADEISGWAASGILHVISLLEASEMRELGIVPEGAVCADHGIRFHSFPIVDRAVPASLSDTRKFIERISKIVASSAPVLVHCRAGIGRSSLIAGAVLLELGLPYESIFPLLTKARRLAVPDTQAQIDWVKAYALQIRSSKSTVQPN